MSAVVLATAASGWLPSIVTVTLAAGLAAILKWLAGRKEEVREESKDQREDVSQDLDVAKFYREESMELRKLISQVRLDFDNERRDLNQQIARLKETNQGQAAELLALKGQIFDLQRDRTRQTTEGTRQTAEGKRQTEEGVRQTIEGQRLDQRRSDMDDEENGQ